MSSRQVRDVTRDLLGTELRVAGVDLVLLDVDRREHVVLHEALGEDDRVLEVVALPRHERDEQVLAERELAEVRRRTVGEHVALLDLARPSTTIGFWLMQVPWFERRNLARRCVTRPPFLYSTVTVSPETSSDRAVVLGQQHVAGVARGARLDTGTDVRRGRPQQRDGLALHVRAHERAVARRRARGTGSAPSRPRRAASARRPCTRPRPRSRSTISPRPARTSTRSSRNRPCSSTSRVRLRDDVLVLVVGREVHDLVGDATALDLAGTASR